MPDETRGRAKTYSMHMSIDGFMRNNKFPRDYTIFQDDNGVPLSPSEALTYLTTEKAKGHKVIPCSAECGSPCKHADRGCTGFDYAGRGCPGRHAIKEESGR